MSYELILDVPDQWWVTANDRPHWAVKAKATRAVRNLACLKARAGRVPPLGVIHVTAYVQYPTGGRADPANASPMGKAAVDGLVDAGVVVDDDHTHVLGPDYRRDVGKCPRGVHRVRLVLVAQGVPF